MIARVKTDTDTSTPTTMVAARQAFSEATLTARLAVANLTLPRYGWVAPLIVTLLGGLLRFWNLAHPQGIVFDETYYTKDAYSMLHYGYERNWAETADESFAAGSPSGIKQSAEFVVHPPVGKWMIAAGMAIFGDNNPFGWRFSAALIGTLSIALVALAAWLLFRSVTVASIAALILSIDGLHLVQSRFALLDIFLMFWILAAFVFLLLDRQHARRKLAAKIAAHAAELGGTPDQKFMTYGPFLGFRYWRLLAGVSAGLAVGTKWNALFFVAIFGVLTVVWDMNARRIVGVKEWVVAGVIFDGIPAFVSMIVVGAVTYTATWTGWLLSDDAYHRQWAAESPGEGVQWLPEALRSLWDYHVRAYSFHSQLDSEHAYESDAWQWLILGKPTSYYYESLNEGVGGCMVDKCSQAVLNIGNPLIWWSFMIVALFALLIFILRRDWRFGALFLVFAVGYFPWFAYPNRTMFYFYALSFEPFLVLTLAGCLGLALGRKTDSVKRRRAGLVIVGIFVAMALLVSVFFYPIWVAETIPYAEWYGRMWFRNWI